MELKKLDGSFSVCKVVDLSLIHISRFDNPKMMRSEALILLGAGREKKIYAIPPYTKVVSLDFFDHPFETEDFQGKCCRLCGASHVYLDEIIDERCV